MSTSVSHESFHDPDVAKYGYTSKMMLAAVVCLFTVIFLLIFLHLYAKWLVRRRRRRESAILALWHTLGPLDAPPAGTNMAKAGLDCKVLALIPVFSYKSGEQQDGMECAVCLSPFEDEEEGRELPPCRHCFHVQCIDSWLQLHSTCPVCRASVTVADEVKVGLVGQIGSGNVVEEEAQTAGTESGAGSRSGEAGEVRVEVGESGEVSGLTGPSEVRVDIETGSRPEEGSSVVQAGTGCSFGSLKRMLSKNRVEKKVLSSNRPSCGEEVEKV